MTYRVDLTARAQRDLRRLYRHFAAAGTEQAHAWFNLLEAAILSLDEFPARSPTIPDDDALQHLLHGTGRNVYRIIYKFDEPDRVVTVAHIRHGSRRPLPTKRPRIST